MAMPSWKRINTLGRQLNRQKGVVDPLTGEQMDVSAHEQTLGDFLDSEHNKEKHDLFLQFIAQENPAMAKAIIEAHRQRIPFSDTQDTYLERKRREIIVMFASAEKVANAIKDPDFFKEMAVADPRLEIIVGKIGEDRTATLLASRLARLAVNEPTGFQTVIRNFRDQRDLPNTKEAKVVERIYEDLLKKYEIPRGDYDLAAAKSADRRGVSPETLAEFQKIANKSLPSFLQALDAKTNGLFSHHRVRNMAGVLQEQQKLQAEADKYLLDISTVLRGTLDADVNKAIQKFLAEGGTFEVQDSRKVITLADYKKAKTDIEREQTTGEREKRFKDALKQEIARLKKPAHRFTPAEVDAFEDRVVKSEEALRDSYKAEGILATILKALFGSKAAMKREINGFRTRIWP